MRLSVETARIACSRALCQPLDVKLRTFLRVSCSGWSVSEDSTSSLNCPTAAWSDKGLVCLCNNINRQFCVPSVQVHNVTELCTCCNAVVQVENLKTDRWHSLCWWHSYKCFECRLANREFSRSLRNLFAAACQLTAETAAQLLLRRQPRGSSVNLKTYQSGNSPEYWQALAYR
jgi:hypothetical protein